MFFFQIESKSWRQLQEEREALMNGEIERTRREAEAMWARAQAEDSQRLGAIQRERERQEGRAVASTTVGAGKPTPASRHGPVTVESRHGPAESRHGPAESRHGPAESRALLP